LWMLVQRRNSMRFETNGAVCRRSSY
jgi:hypothetical protein